MGESRICRSGWQIQEVRKGRDISLAPEISAWQCRPLGEK